MEVGSVSIELGLERSKFDRGINQVSNTKLAPIDAGLKLDSKAFNRQLSGLKPIASVGLKADTRGLQNQLKSFDARVNLHASTRSLQNQLNSLDGRVKLHGDIRGLQQQLNSRLSAKITLNADSIGLTEGITKAIEKGFESAKPKNNIFGSLISAPFKLVGGAFSQIIGGALLGLGQPIGESVSKGIVTGVESSFSEIIGSFDLVAQKIGEKFASRIQDVLAATGKGTKVAKSFENFIGLEDLATESASSKATKTQAKQQKRNTAEQELLRQQRNQVFDTPELATAPAQIKQTRDALLKQQQAAMAEYEKAMKSPVGQRMTALQQKSRSGKLSNSEVFELQSASESLQSKISGIAKKIKSIQDSLEALNIQEEEIEFVRNRPTNSLAAIGNKSAKQVLNNRQNQEQSASELQYLQSKQDKDISNLEAIKTRKNQIGGLNSKIGKIDASYGGQIAAFESKTNVGRLDEIDALVANKQSSIKSLPKVNKQKKKDLEKQLEKGEVSAGDYYGLLEGIDKDTEAQRAQLSQEINKLIREREEILPSSEIEAVKKKISTVSAKAQKRIDKIKAIDKTKQDKSTQLKSQVESGQISQTDADAQLEELNKQLNPQREKLTKSVSALLGRKKQLENSDASIKGAFQERRSLSKQRDGLVKTSTANNDDAKVEKLQQDIERRQKGIKARIEKIRSLQAQEAALQNELIIPQEAKTPEARDSYLRDRQTKLATRELNEVNTEIQASSQKLASAQQDKTRSEDLLSEANPFQTIEKAEKQLVEISETFQSKLESFNKDISELEQQAGKELAKIQNIDKLRKGKALELNQKMASGEISQADADTQLSQFYQKTEVLKNESKQKGKDLLQQKTNKEGERDTFTKSTIARQNKLVDQRQKAIEQASKVDPSKLKIQIEAYETWISQANAIIKEESEKLKTLQAKKAKLAATISSLKEPTKLDVKENNGAAQEQQQLPKIYTNVAAQVAKLSGIALKPGQIPKLVASELPGGGLGAYDFSENIIKISKEALAQIDKGKITKTVLDTLIHELRHAIQGNFGQNKKRNTVDLITPDASEAHIAKFAQGSVDVGAAEYKKDTGKELSQAARDKNYGLEADAYTFTSRNVDTIAKSIKGVRPESALPGIKKALGAVQQIKLPELPTASAAFSNSKELQSLLTKNYTAEGVKTLARRLGIPRIDEPGANKSYLTKEISSLAGTAQGRDGIQQVLSQLGDEFKLAKAKTGQASTIPKLENEAGSIEALKRNRAALKLALTDLGSLSAKNQRKILGEIIKQGESQIKIAEQMSRNFKLDDGQAVSGVRSQFDAVINEAKKQLSELNNQLGNTQQAIAQSLESVTEGVKLFAVQTPDEIERRLKELEQESLNPPSLPKIDSKIQKLESEIDNPSPEISSKLKRIEAEIDAGVSSKKNVRGSKSARRRRARMEQELALEKARAEAGVVKEATLKPADTEAELQQMAASMGKTIKSSKPVKTNTAGLQFNNAIKRGFIQFEEQLGAKIRVQALETAEQIFNNLAAFETAFEGGTQAVKGIDKAKQVVKQAPEYIKGRARNAVFTKARYIFDNSDAINTVVAEKVNSDPTGKKTNLAQQFNNQRGQLAEIIEAFNKTPSETGFKLIRSTLRDIEQTLKELGTPLPQINKLLGEYKQKIKELQGEGEIPLDFEVPEAEKLPFLIDLFEKFGDKAAIAANFISKIGPAIKGFIALQAGIILQNILTDISQKAFQAFVELDRLKTALNFSSGSKAAGTRNLEFVNQTSEDLGIPLKQSQEGFSGLNAAARRTVLEGQGVKDLFLGMAQASTTLSLSNEQNSRGFLALSQILSKGKVSAEELRGQLAESGLTGAIGIAARAIGTTEEEFNRLLESGQILSQDFLPKFAKQLQAEFGDAAQDASGNAQSAIYKFENAYLQLQQNIGEGVAPAAMVGLNALATLLKGIAAIGKELAIIIGAVSIALMFNLGRALYATISNIIATKLVTGTLGGALGSLASTLANSTSVKIAAGFFVVFEAINLINQAINTKLIQSFDDSARAAKRAAEESAKYFNKAKPKENKPTGTTPESSSGFGRFSDKYLQPFLEWSPGNILNKLMGKKMLTYGELEQAGIKSRVKVISSSADSYLKDARTRMGELQSRTGKVGELPGIDAELQQAEQARQVLQAENRRNYTNKGLAIPADKRQQLEAQNLKIQDLNTRRSEIAKPITRDLAEADRQISAIKADIENLKTPEAVAALGGTEAAEKEKEALQARLDNWKKYKAEIEATIASLKVDPVLAFTAAIRQLNLAFAENQENNQVQFDARKAVILKQQSSGFSVNKFNSRETGLKLALEEQKKAYADLQNAQASANQFDAELAQPAFQSTLQRLGVSPDASAAKIDDLLKNTSDESDKNILEKLKAGREQKNKLSEARAAVEESNFKFKQSNQDLTLAQFQDTSANQQSALQKAEAQKLGGIKAAQQARVISEAEAAENIARIQLGSTQQQQKNIASQLAALKFYYSQGTISAEEFNTRNRELSNQQVDLEKQTADQRLALFEASNRRKLEAIELANRKAEATINLSQTNRTTAVKVKVLDSSISPEQAAREQTQVDQDVTEKRIANIKRLIAENKRLGAEKVQDEKTTTEKGLQLNQELAQANQQLIDSTLR